MLVFSAADFEDFRQPRPDMPAEMEGELEEVVRILAENRWPWRLHATYDETISRALDVFERVNQDIPLEGLNWFFDHAETISDESIDRIAALGGGIAVQHRMAYQGEYFVERYGLGAAEATPPIARMLDRGVKVSAGTDATRVASYNPWVSLAWLVTGKTVGGLAALSAAQLPRPRDGAADVDRERHLVLQRGRQEGPHRGRPARRSDRAGPRLFLLRRRRDCRHRRRDLTMVGGKVVYGAGDFARFDESAPPPAMPDWSPVRELRRLCRLGRTAGAGKQRCIARLVATCGCAQRLRHPRP